MNASDITTIAMEMGRSLALFHDSLGRPPSPKEKDILWAACQRWNGIPEEAIMPVSERKLSQSDIDQVECTLSADGSTVHFSRRFPECPNATYHAEVTCPFPVSRAEFLPAEWLTLYPKLSWTWRQPA